MIKSPIPLVVGVLALVVIGCCGAPAQSQPLTHLVVKETRRGRVPAGFVENSLVISPDGARWACVVVGNNRAQVVLDGQPQTVYLKVVAETLCFSPDSKRFGYIAQVDTPVGGRGVAVIDGQEGPTFEAYGFLTGGQAIFFSPNSKRVGYVISNANQCQAIIDGVGGKKFAADPLDIGVIWSPDSRRWAFGLIDAKDQAAVVINDVAGPWFEAITGQARGITDDKKTIKAEYLAELSKTTVAFSADGQHVVYSARRKKNDNVVVLDGKVIAESQRGTLSWIYPDGRVVYEIQGDGKEGGEKSYLVVDGKKHKEYSATQNHRAFSPDGKHFAYFGSPKLLRRRVVLDGVEGKEYDTPPNATDRPDDLTFSPDSQHLAARVHRDMKALVTLDGVEGKLYEEVLRPQFSPDSKRLCYIAIAGVDKVLVVVDGVEGKAYTDIAIGPNFSPDSKQVAYAAKVGQGWRLVVDGAESVESYEGFMEPALPRFVAPNKVTTTAVRGNDLFRLEAELVTVDLKAALADLKAKDPAVRQKGAEALERLGPAAKDAIPALVEAIKDKDPAIIRALAAIDPLNPNLPGIDPRKIAIEPDPGTLTKYQGQVGKELYIEVLGRTAGAVYGTNIYTDDSTLATAAVHAGVLKDGEKGVVKVTIVVGQKQYQSSTQNGITSQSYGPWRASFSVAAVRLDLSSLIADLKAADASTRKKAAETLGRMGLGAKAAVPVLVEAIKDKDQAVAEAATQALQAIDPENKAVVDLVPLKASANGKYSKLLKKIEVPGDKGSYGEFKDSGYYSSSSYAGFDNLPAGYWVYVYPHWYIWGEQKKDLPLEKPKK